jgi:flagellar hook-associated protein 1 FlgK
MAGLFATINAASSALNADSQAINVTSNNIANLNNPDYSRESVAFDDLGSVQTDDGPESMGVTTSLQQMRSTVLDQMVQQQASITSGVQAQQTVLQQGQASLGENITSASTSGSSSTTSTSGLSVALDNFFSAFQGLAANPTDSGGAETVVEQAGVLVDRFQEISSNLSQVQTDANSQVSEGVTTANNLLTQIAGLNSQISALSGAGSGAAAALIDQREGALETLAGLIPVSVQTNAQGEDQVSTTDASGNPVALVTNASVSNPLSFAAGVLSAGSPPVALGLSSGSLQGTLSASTGPIQTLQTSLDQLAQQIVTSVNATYNPTNAANGNLFLSSGTTASTIALDPNFTPATVQAGSGAAGDNSIAVAVGNLVNQSFSTASGDAINGTITQFYAGTVSNLGEALDTVNTEVTDQTNVQTVVVNQRQSVSGVSVDEEMANLMTYQTAYQASSEVFQVLNSLLQNVTENMVSAG